MQLRGYRRRPTPHDVLTATARRTRLALGWKPQGLILGPLRPRTSGLHTFHVSSRFDYDSDPTAVFIQMAV